MSRRDGPLALRVRRAESIATVSSTVLSEVLRLWSRAAAFDPTVGVSAANARQLLRKQVHCEQFQRRRLFSRMASGEVSLFTGVKVPILTSGQPDPTAALIGAIRRAFRRERVTVMQGRVGRRRTTSVSRLIDCWEQRRGIVSITDLHIRGTPLDKAITTDALSEFNLLYGGSDAISWHEMMTMVVSAEGTVTDSHSDDPDGSNHCFAGSKLWLIWDTFEGRSHGLQDVERDRVARRARFDMRTFLKLPSARWFLISPGMTLFLPGDFTHKVITLGRYIGVGSFYVSIPNCVRTISRWLLHGSLWSTTDDVSTILEVANAATSFIRRTRAATPDVRRRLGLPFLEHAVRLWESELPVSVRVRLLRVPAFAALVAEALRQ